jgi:thioredoxin 1
MIMEYTFTSENFEEEVLKSDVPVLVDMFATWCGPCKMMAPVVAQLAEEYEGTVKVGKLDIDQNVDIVAQYKIMSVPTFLVIKDGEVVKKLIGAVSKEELVEAIGQAK